MAAIDCLVTSGLDDCRKCFTTKSQYQHRCYYHAVLTLLERPNVKLVQLVVISTAAFLCQKIIPHVQYVDNTFVSPYFYVFNLFYSEIYVTMFLPFTLIYTGLFISPSGISELDCATTNTDTAERSISIGRESLQVFFLY